MRPEHGGGTLFSHLIDRPKLSLKVTAVAAAESNDIKKRLSNGENFCASLAGLSGPKASVGGSILPQTNMQHRPKGGGVSMMVMQEQRMHNKAVQLHADLSTMERIKELRARLEPLLKSKSTHSPSFSSPPTPPYLLSPPKQSTVQVVSLPQWGLYKKARRSRLESARSHVGAATAKALLPRSVVDESVNPARPNGWIHASCVITDSDGPSSRGTTAATRRSNGNLFASARQGSFSGEVLRAASSHKCEPYISSARQRSDGSTEAILANTQSNGHTEGGSLCRGRGCTTEAHAPVSSSIQTKPSSELEWPRILIGLSRKEKEDDFLIFKGSKLPQRPKKRPKVVEKALHKCTPGNSLYDLTRGRYDVREKKTNKKRLRGLKAMGSAESDSD